MKATEILTRIRTLNDALDPRNRRMATCRECGGDALVYRPCDRCRPCVVAERDKLWDQLANQRKGQPTYSHFERLAQNGRTNAGASTYERVAAQLTALMGRYLCGFDDEAYRGLRDWMDHLRDEPTHAQQRVDLYNEDALPGRRLHED